MDLKIGETAREIEVTSATIRNWVKEFGEFLSPSATSQRRKRFTPSDIDTLKNIKKLRNDGFTYSEIHDEIFTVTTGEVLGVEEMITEETHKEQLQQPQDNAIAIPEVFEFINQALNNQTLQHEREIKAKDETIQLLREELKRARLPWWKKLF